MRRLLPLLLVLAISPAGWSQTLPWINLKDPQAVAALQRDLASNDFATRDRAQALLDGAPLAARDELAKLADATSDPEAQSRLKARVDMLDDIRVTSVPGISLELKDATLPQVAEALALATGQPFTGEQGNNLANNDERYTLKADSLPFWEIQRQLNTQHPIWFNVGVNDIRMNRSTMNWRDTSMTRGLAVFIQDLKAPPAGTTPNNRYTTTLGLGIDPRICILQLKPPEFGAVSDNAKNRWTWWRPVPQCRRFHWEGGSPFRVRSRWSRGAGMGKTIPSLRGVFPIVVQSAVASKTFDPAKDALGVPFVMGNVEINVTRCSIKEGAGAANATVAFDLEVHVAPGKDADGTPFPMGPVAVNLLDGAGKAVIVRTLALGFIGSMSNSFSLPAKGPLTMRLDVTTAVREVKVPFEFKDVPVP